MRESLSDKDTNWRLQQLQVQRDHLYSKTESQEEALKQAEKQIEVDI